MANSFKHIFRKGENMRKSKFIALLLSFTMIMASISFHVKAEEKPVMEVTSDILGLADTGNKSTLKETLVKENGPGDTNLYYYDEEGNRVIYEN